MSGPVTLVSTRATDCHWVHGVRSIAEEAHDSKPRERPYANEAEPHLAESCSHQKRKQPVIQHVQAREARDCCFSKEECPVYLCEEYGTEDI
jgi:hypothetical protein